MNLSNIKKIVSREGKIIIVEGDDVMVIMSLDEYEKSKSVPVAPAIAMPAVTKESEPQPEPEQPSHELTLDDLPF